VKLIRLRELLDSPSPLDAPPDAVMWPDEPILSNAFDRARASVRNCSMPNESVPPAAFSNSTGLVRP
jgi:hypothetical protein